LSTGEGGDEPALVCSCGLLVLEVAELSADGDCFDCAALSVEEICVCEVCETARDRP